MTTGSRIRANGGRVCAWCSHVERRHRADGCEGLAEYGGPPCGCRRMADRRQAFVNDPGRAIMAASE